MQSKQSVKTASTVLPFDVNGMKKYRIRHRTQVRERGQDSDKILDNKLMRLLASSELPEEVLGIEEPELHQVKSMRLVIDEDKIKRQK